MSRKARFITLMLVLMIAVSACQMPGRKPAEEQSQAGDTPSFPLPGSALGSPTVEGTEPKGAEVPQVGAQPGAAPSDENQPPVASCPSPLGWTTVVVQPGDTLESLAQKFGLSAQQLMDANCLLDASVPVGVVLSVPEEGQQEIVIPQVPVGQAGGEQGGGQQPPVVVAAPSGAVPSSYTLHRGEFPYCVARRFDIHPNDLLAANGLVRGMIYPGGLKLTIPASARVFPTARALRAHPASYTVQTGDNIYIVACYFGDVDPMAIASANGLSHPYTLTPGTVLNIP